MPIARNGVVITKLIGTTLEVWSELAKLVEDTGVDMLELNWLPPPQRPWLLKRLNWVVTPKLRQSNSRCSQLCKDPVFVKLTAEAVNPMETAKRL